MLATFNPSLLLPCHEFCHSKQAHDIFNICRQIVGRGTKSEYQKRRERSDACTEGMLDTLADGLFQDSIKRMDERFNQLLGNFIAGHSPLPSISCYVPASPFPSPCSEQNTISESSVRICVQLGHVKNSGVMSSKYSSFSCLSL